jgi:hypothetical protein
VNRSSDEKSFVRNKPLFDRSIQVLRKVKFIKVFDLSNLDGLKPTETPIYSDTSISKPNGSATYICGDSNEGISTHNCR